MKPNKRATKHFSKRHARWYEVIWLNGLFQLLLGLCCVVVLPALTLWGADLAVLHQNTKLNSIGTAGTSFAIATGLYRRVSRYTVAGGLAYILPILATAFLASAGYLLLTRSSYSITYLVFCFALALLWFYAAYFLGRRYRTKRYAVVPAGRGRHLQSNGLVELCPLNTANLDGRRYNAVIADLHTQELTPEWERFLARCVLAHIPVIHITHAQETFTGRIAIAHLSENEMGSLIPPPFYTSLKRLLDILAVVITSPVVLPLMLATAVAVKIDSQGPVLFMQNRVGQGNRDFTIYKFRSMRTDSERDGARLASDGDSRITRTGRFIRKTRLDELPQLWNVLKGDMSLIGPRPEQRYFVNLFEQEIPFYTYRHVVKPGITGWAQVMQGYADDAESTKLKVQYDFYYIKHFSLWLDLLVTLKTIRIIVTGFGAR